MGVGQCLGHLHPDPGHPPEVLPVLARQVGPGRAGPVCIAGEGGILGRVSSTTEVIEAWTRDRA